MAQGYVSHLYAYLGILAEVQTSISLEAKVPALVKSTVVVRPLLIPIGDMESPYDLTDMDRTADPTRVDLPESISPRFTYDAPPSHLQLLL